MALSFRHLVSILTVFIGLSVPNFGAPEGKTKAATFRIFSPYHVSDLTYDFEGKPRKVSVGGDSFSQDYPCASGQPVTFYRTVPSSNPTLPPSRATVAVAQPETSSDRYLIVLIAAPGHRPPPPPSAHAADDPNYNPPANTPDRLQPLIFSDTKNSQGALRIISLSSRNTSLKIGQNILSLGPLKTTTVAYPSDKKTWVQVAVQDQGGWHRISSGPQIFPEGTSMTIFLSDLAGAEKIGGTRPLTVSKILEQVSAGDQAVVPGS